VDKDLLFAGTEFGLFFTVDGGQHWKQLKAELPTIAVRDIAIQRIENDLVLATFGRGFYILDDYSPLRELKQVAASQEAHIFPIKNALMYIESNPLGSLGTKKAFQGESFFTADNPRRPSRERAFLRPTIHLLGRLLLITLKKALRLSGRRG